MRLAPRTRGHWIWLVVLGLPVFVGWRSGQFTLGQSHLDRGPNPSYPLALAPSLLGVVFAIKRYFPSRFLLMGGGCFGLVLIGGGAFTRLGYLLVGFTIAGSWRLIALNIRWVSPACVKSVIVILWFKLLFDLASGSLSTNKFASQGVIIYSYLDYFPSIRLILALLMLLNRPQLKTLWIVLGLIVVAPIAVEASNISQIVLIVVLLSFLASKVVRVPPTLVGAFCLVFVCVLPVLSILRLPGINGVNSIGDRRIVWSGLLETFASDPSRVLFGGTLFHVGSEGGSYHNQAWDLLGLCGLTGVLFYLKFWWSQFRKLPAEYYFIVPVILLDAVQNTTSNLYLSPFMGILFALELKQGQVLENNRTVSSPVLPNAGERRMVGSRVHRMDSPRQGYL
jgi:hypothetical protein